MNSAAPRLLVVSERSADAELVGQLLRAEFDQVALSIDPERAVRDFEQQQPQVLVLAFHALEKAERYYLGLYRQSGSVDAIPHHTVLLCQREDVNRAYDLCRRRNFDDYVMFWPSGFDPPRLLMAVHLGLRRISALHEHGNPQLAEQARRITELEVQLQARLNHGRDQAERAAQSLQSAQLGIDAAIDHFSRRLLDGERRQIVSAADRPAFEAEVQRLKSDQVDRQLDSVAAAVRPMPNWFGEVGAELRSQLVAILTAPSRTTPPRYRVLAVDDDEFQHRLLAHLLADADLDLSFATDASGALALIQQEPPDLILMDIDLPDLSGVEVTLRLKKLPRFATIPVVMITGHSEKQMVVECLKAGAANYVVKPLEKDVLLGKLRQCLRART